MVIDIGVIAMGSICHSLLLQILDTWFKMHLVILMKNYHMCCLLEIVLLKTILFSREKRGDQSMSKIVHNGTLSRNSHYKGIKKMWRGLGGKVGKKGNGGIRCEESQRHWAWRVNDILIGFLPACAPIASFCN